MKNYILPTLLLLFYLNGISQATLRFGNCPNVNVGVARAGTNSDVQNPYYIYSVNGTTGALTLFSGGPLLKPGAPNQNLQVNAVGVNTTDGFMYGLETETTGSNPKFLRFDYGYGVTMLGGVVPPVSPTGFLGIVNTAAGDMDRFDNYYFTAVTVNPTANGFSLDKLFLGKIPGASTVSGAPTPVYYEIDYSDVNCSNYIATLSTDVINSGIKDITFNPATNSFFFYATYKPVGSPNYSGQLIELKLMDTSPLKYKMYCYPIVNTHSAETAGSLIDNAGNFLVLLTDGTMGKIQNSGGTFTYSGAYSNVNTATGLPNPLRGDLASCGGPAGAPTPITLTSFKASVRDCRTSFVWTSENESNMRFYELEQSRDNIVFTGTGTVPAENKGRSTYSFTLPSADRTSYYRLKMVDENNRANYSGVIPVRSSCATLQHGFVIATNPVINDLKLNWFGMNAAGIQVRVFNSMGVQVLNATRQVPQGSSVMQLSTAGLAPGIYIVRTYNTNTREAMEMRFVKQ